MIVIVIKLGAFSRREEEEFQMVVHAYNWGFTNDGSKNYLGSLTC